jgi:putative oxygen-independent coproporphyrinogen III oxidase
VAAHHYDVGEMSGPFSLYIHIPYCISKCPYCDFNSHVVPEIPEGSYTDTLVRELERFSADRDWQNRAVQSIFFGGGTPSTFLPESIGRILERVATLFPLESGCEITLEANPGAVDQEKFLGYHEAGVNRISIGVQSFQPTLLKFLGRAHSADEAATALHMVRQAGFNNFSFDLIYANPGQTPSDLNADLDVALAFNSPHLSAYNLTFEEGTPFHREYRAGNLHVLSEDDEVAMAELIEDKLSSAGLRRYEISNYAKPGWESHHNMNYWQGGDYLGIGAGAHSYQAMDTRSICGRRWSNEKNPGRYMALIGDAGHAIVETDEIDRAKAASEFMFLGLRMTKGISIELFNARFGQTPVERFPPIVDWIKGGFLEEIDGYLRLTRKGMMVANSIFVEFA